jgi:transcriptional regulator GlxA family with amidase domain
MTRARELLEFSRSTVDEIAANVGHDDTRGSRRAFLKIEVEAP